MRADVGFGEYHSGAGPDEPKRRRDVGPSTSRMQGGSLVPFVMCGRELCRLGPTCALRGARGSLGRGCIPEAEVFLRSADGAHVSLATFSMCPRSGSARSVVGTPWSLALRSDAVRETAKWSLLLTIEFGGEGGAWAADAAAARFWARFGWRRGRAPRRSSWGRGQETERAVAPLSMLFAWAEAAQPNPAPTGAGESSVAPNSALIERINTRDLSGAGLPVHRISSCGQDRWRATRRWSQNSDACAKAMGLQEGDEWARARYGHLTSESDRDLLRRVARRGSG